MLLVVYSQESNRWHTGTEMKNLINLIPICGVQLRIILKLKPSSSVGHLCNVQQVNLILKLSHYGFTSSPHTETHTTLIGQIATLKYWNRLEELNKMTSNIEHYYYFLPPKSSHNFIGMHTSGFLGRAPLLTQTWFSQVFSAALLAIRPRCMQHPIHAFLWWTF